jgi:thioredoxin reductase
MESRLNDVAIVGGGAAGLSAALVLGRARRRVVVIDAGAPRNAPAEHMQGFLSRDGMPPSELLRIARDEVRGYGVEIVEDSVIDAGPEFELRLGSGRTIEARHVLLATGAVDQLPDIDGARNAGVATSSIARIATAGKCATSRSESLGPDLVRSTMRSSYASGART